MSEMSEIPDDIMKFAKQIADTMDDCVKDFDWDGIQLVVAKAILYERNSCAAERDRLREENQRFRMALDEIATNEEYRDLTAEEAKDVARAALNPAGAS